jgi:hypothetical protein
MAGIGSIGTIKSAGGKVFKRSSTQGKMIRSGGGTRRLGFLGGLASLPALTIALPITGALGVAGGALHLAAAGIGTANTVARAGLLATSGVMRATGGLTGGGQSGNVKKEKQIQMVQSTLNKKDATGRDRSSTGLADVQSTLADYDMPEGAMSMLPTGDEDGIGMLSGMLHQIAVNTSYLGGIDSKIDALVGLSSISVIEQAQEDRGDDPPGEKQDGFIKRSYNSLKDGFSRISSGLGGAAKNILKGLGLIGGLIAFKKFEPQITSGLASLFENVSGFFESMSMGGDPSDGIVDYFDNMMENTILPALTSMATTALEALFRALKIAINSILPDYLPKLDTEKVISTDNPITEEMIENNQSSTTMSAFEKVKTEMGGLENMGSMRNVGGFQFFGGLEGTDEQQKVIQAALIERLEYMYSVYDKTGGRVQWTNIGSGFDKIMGMGDAKTLLGKHSVRSIMTSQPIVDGVVRLESVLKDPNLLATPNLTGESLEMYLDNLIENTTLEQDMLDLGNYPGMSKKIQKKQLKFDSNIKENLLLLEGVPSSSSNGQGEITAAIDASHNSQHLHETTVAGLTSVYHSDLNMPAFMGHNQVA